MAENQGPGGAAGAAGEPTSEIEDEVRRLFRQGGYADAVPVIQAHLDAAPDDAFAFELMADALRYSGDKPAAAAALTRASEVWAGKGQTLQSIAAQKRAIKLGVEPDFSRVRSAGAGAASSQRVPTPLFDDLADDEFESVAEKLVSHSYSAGDVAVREGEPGDGMYVIVRGDMEVVLGQGGAETHLADLSVGDFFGESALLSGRPRTATIRARASAECLALSRRDFDELTERFPRMREVVEDFNRRRAASTIETLVKRRGGAGPA